MLFQKLLLLLSLLFEIVHILILVHVHCVHLEVKHVELIMNDFLCLLLLILSSFKTSLDQ